MRRNRDIIGIFWTFFWIIIAIVIATVAAGIIIGVLGYGGPYYGRYYGMMGYYPGMWIIGPFFMIIPFIIFFLIIYWVIELASQGHNGDIDNTANDPIEILNYRYAKGEITEEQYKKMKEELVRK